MLTLKNSFARARRLNDTFLLPGSPNHFYTGATSGYIHKSVQCLCFIAFSLYDLYKCFLGSSSSSDGMKSLLDLYCLNLMDLELHVLVLGTGGRYCLYDSCYHFSMS